MSDPWPEPAIATLKSMWSGGYSGTAISRALATQGFDHSRCSVLGKASRLSLPHRTTGARPAVPAKPRSKPPAKMALPSIAKADIPTIGIPLMLAKDGQCRFPLWLDAEMPDFPVCGALAAGTYCVGHKSLTSAPAKTRP